MIHRSRKPNMPANAPEKPAQGFLFGLNTEFGGTFMGVPFADAMMPEVCARVVYRLAQRYARKWPSDKLYGPEVLQAICSDLEPLERSLLLSCALSALYATIRREKLIKWRDNAVLLSRMGYGFRRCWYDDYKANRRDPRVTNRGVMRSGS